MLKHNLLLFLRNIKKHKSSFLINLIGLSSALACVLLVYLWVSDELNKDKFHEHEERLYQVLRHVPDGQGSLATYSSNSSLMLTALQTEVPEVEMATAVFEFDTGAMVKTDDKKMTAIGNMASEDYFKLFSYPLLHGSMHTVLKDINAVVISKEMAHNFFGQGNPMGKTLTIKHGEEGVDGVLTETGVFDIPVNS